MANYIFPPDLEKTPVRFMINTRQYLPVKRGTETGGREFLKNKNNYILPIPQQGINDIFNINYDVEAMQAIGGIMTTLQEAGRQVQAGNAVDAATGIVRTGLEFMLARGKDALAKTVSTVPGFSTAQVQGALEQLAGVIENPNLAALFKGVRIRNHNFQWKFLPRNLTESTQIRELINQLQTDSLPSTSNMILGTGLRDAAGAGSAAVGINQTSKSKNSNLTLGYPDVAFLKIVGPSYDLITFNRDGCFISDIRVSYSEGEVAFFKDKYHPAEIGLSIQFVERTIVTRDDFISRMKTKTGGTAQLSNLIFSEDSPRVGPATGGNF